MDRAMDVALTTDPKLRRGLLQNVMANILTILCVMLALPAALWAGTPMPIVVTWAVCCMLTMGGSYIAIRSGSTRTWGDPCLTLLQMSVALTATAFAYAMLGPMRAATLPLFTVVLLFGVFHLPARQLAWMAVFGLVVAGLSMFGMAVARPDLYTLPVEATHFLVLLFTAPTAPLLAGRYASVRERLQRQQDDFQRVRHLATRDELTGLLNRRQMADMLERAEQFKSRTGRPFCVAVVDLDHFKRINDVHGHAGGDEVLRRFAELSKTVLRDNDAVARWGGEEFVILMGDTKMDAAKACVERVRARMAREPISLGDTTVQVTLSAGIAEPLDGESYERALSRADDALYAAKAHGRDRVMAA
jgi:diguanylate cyclase